MDIILAKSASFDAVISQESSEGKGNRHHEQPEGSCSQHLPACITRAFTHLLSPDSTQHASSPQAIPFLVKPCLFVISAAPTLLAACTAIYNLITQLKVLLCCADEPSGS